VAKEITANILQILKKLSLVLLLLMALPPHLPLLKMTTMIMMMEVLLMTIFLNLPAMR
jgi:hypothetical protein